MVLVWQRLQTSADPQLAGIAAKSLKETRYHLSHASDWLVRLGDGTEESHQRAQAALDHLLALLRSRSGSRATPPKKRRWPMAQACACSDLRDDWNAIVNETLNEATLQRSDTQPHVGYVHQGHLGAALRTPGLPAGRNAKPGPGTPAGRVVTTLAAPASHQRHRSRAGPPERPGNSGGFAHRAGHFARCSRGR